jgi:D-aminopeptidase
MSVNPLVAETNDGYLNDIRGRHISPDDVLSAIKNAKGGMVEEGSVGAGTGDCGHSDSKAGIGTSSRKLPANLGGFTVGVLVQSNFGGIPGYHGAPGRYRIESLLFKGRTQPAWLSSAFKAQHFERN